MQLFKYATLPAEPTPHICTFDVVTCVLAHRHGDRGVERSSPLQFDSSFHTQSNAIEPSSWLIVASQCTHLTLSAASNAADVTPSRLVTRYGTKGARPTPSVLWNAIDVPKRAHLLVLRPVLE